MTIRVADALVTVQDLYILLDLERRAEVRLSEFALKPWISPESIERLGTYLGDVRLHLDRHVKPLARAFRDYIALACAGEARHARDRCSHYWPNWYKPGDDRSYAIDGAHRYNPDDLLVAAVDLFGRHWHHTNYGGKSWKGIAEVGLLYGTIPDLAFLDISVDLSHNSGLFLDKGTIFIPPNSNVYKYMLECKLHGSLLDEDLWTPVVLPGLFDLVERGRYSFGLHDAMSIMADHDPYWPDILVRWEGNPFKPVLQAPATADDEESDEEDSNEEDEGDESVHIDLGHYQEHPAREKEPVYA
jgi:hypothetical protein